MGLKQRVPSLPQLTACEAAAAECARPGRELGELAAESLLAAKLVALSPGRRALPSRRRGPLPLPRCSSPALPVPERAFPGLLPHSDCLS